MTLMRPLIVIGAPDEMRTALEPYAQVGHIEHHPTAEAAHFALLDLLDKDPELGALPPEVGWNVHVAYGPRAYGALAAGNILGTSGRLRHGGRTLVLAWDVDPDPGRPRRVIEGRADLPPITTPWQVSAAISADYVVDLAREVGLPFLVRLLEWKDAAHS